ncbi:uncharacterized protein [Periplaneta americana]|uniref:uncharacterized protein isoform X4 n=1 Tax=Periplaneta americana TaxID=6978 RepID=UPI0037E7A0EF
MKREESGICKKVALTAAERMRNMRKRRKLAFEQAASTSEVPHDCISEETASTSPGTIAMDTIKAELEIDPLASEIEETRVENENPLSVEGNFLEVNVNEIKVEPSDLSCDSLPDVKCEGNEDPVCPEFKFEVENRSASEPH